MQQVVTNLGLYLVCQFNYYRLGVAHSGFLGHDFPRRIKYGQKNSINHLFHLFFLDDFNNQFITFYRFCIMYVIIVCFYFNKQGLAELYILI